MYEKTADMMIMINDSCIHLIWISLTYFFVIKVGPKNNEDAQHDSNPNEGIVRVVIRATHY